MTTSYACDRFRVISTLSHISQITNDTYLHNLNYPVYGIKHGITLYMVATSRISTRNGFASFVANHTYINSFRCMTFKFIYIV